MRASSRPTADASVYGCEPFPGKLISSAQRLTHVAVGEHASPRVPRFYFNVTYDFKVVQ